MAYVFCPDWKWVKIRGNPNTGWADKRPNNPNYGEDVWLKEKPISDKMMNRMKKHEV